METLLAFVSLLALFYLFRHSFAAMRKRYLRRTYIDPRDVIELYEFLFALMVIAFALIFCDSFAK